MTGQLCNAAVRHFTCCLDWAEAENRWQLDDDAPEWMRGRAADSIFICFVTWRRCAIEVKDLPNNVFVLDRRAIVSPSGLLGPSFEAPLDAMWNVRSFACQFVCWC